jgi:8-oxo-dGTP pyrophosphatase MutT (NUDIX family)
MSGFELSASVVLWNETGEILVMKRAGGFASGGWFIPGGHVEPGERPSLAAAREVFEESGIAIDEASLTITGVMTYEVGTEANPRTAHTIIYNAPCPAAAEAAINDEHVYFRWMTPEAYIARFLDPAMLRERGASASAIALAEEVARVVREAAAAWPAAS